MNADPFNLDRFLVAQDRSYDGALKELRRGIKTGHWIWYIFPQISGLGFSETARHYSIRSIEEAKAYLNHRILGERLVQCVEAVLAIEGRSAEQIFGHPDDLKFRSCLTLFAAASERNDVFRRALDKYFGGKFDPLTVQALPEHFERVRSMNLPTDRNPQL